MNKVIYNTKYIYTKKVGKGETKELFETLSEIIGIPVNKQGYLCLLGNLFLAIKGGYEEMMISSDKNYYSSGVICHHKKIPTDVSYRDARKFMDALTHTWNCLIKKGSNLSKREGEYSGGSVVFSEELRYEVLTMGYDNLIESVEKMKMSKAEVSLKKFRNVKSQAREEVTFTPDEEVQSMRRVISDYNKMMANYDIRLNGVKLDCETYRLFLDDTEHYGRFHCQYQTLPSLDRSRILIGGESVIEVDIVSSHPSILLSEVGIDSQEVSIYNFPKVNDKLKELYGDNFPMIDRKTIKPFVLLAINCDSKQSCIRALINKPEIQELFGTKHEVYNVILNEIEDWLSPIAHQFYRSQGLRLMKIESDIVFCVMDLVQQNNIPTLFVHDSFICRLSDLDSLLYYIEVGVKANIDHELRLDIKIPQEYDL
mgnify:CR=1 FL=1